MAAVGVIAAVLVTVGNAGGVGSTVAGVRADAVHRGDRPLSCRRRSGKFIRGGKRLTFRFWCRRSFPASILLLAQVNENTRGAYQILVDAAVILYFIPFIYMYAAAIKLYGRGDRSENRSAVVIPGGRFGVCLAGGIRDFSLSSSASCCPSFRRGIPRANFCLRPSWWPGPCCRYCSG